MLNASKDYCGPAAWAAPQTKSPAAYPLFVQVTAEESGAGYTVRPAKGPDNGLGAQGSEVLAANNNSYADVFNQETGQHLVRLTANGSFKASVLLGDLCQALLQGSARLETPGLERPQWFKVSCNFLDAYSEGQEVDVYQTKEAPSWFLLAARPRSCVGGRTYEGLNLYTSDPVLAERLTMQIQTGMLSSAHQGSMAEVLEGLLELGAA